MSNIAKKPVVRKVSRVAKPRHDIDRKALRKDINKKFSETLAHLAR